MSKVPTVLDWVIGGNRSCTEATECKGNGSCKDAKIGGYHCICNEGYETSTSARIKTVVLVIIAVILQGVTVVLLGQDTPGMQQLHMIVNLLLKIQNLQ
ncbi:hypothetical protein L6452_40611 [Arctium lappa]|uniref:Uncharacterized protein n=1 Tax=Arctium lappa TaxID=4217 RepID=A0ACB8XN53_ARCLA|nr:hypothetical protein L6452_40611 [Arctium lappa]